MSNEPTILVSKCPKCGSEFDKALEPMLTAMAKGKTGFCTLVLECPVCTYNAEYSLGNCAPLSGEHFVAVCEAMSQLAKISFITGKNIDVEKIAGENQV